MAFCKLVRMPTGIWPNAKTLSIAIEFSEEVNKTSFNFAFNFFYQLPLKPN